MARDDYRNQRAQGREDRDSNYAMHSSVGDPRSSIREDRDPESRGARRQREIDPRDRRRQEYGGDDSRGTVRRHGEDERRPNQSSSQRSPSPVRRHSSAGPSRREPVSGHAYFSDDYDKDPGKPLSTTNTGPPQRHITDSRRIESFMKPHESSSSTGRRHHYDDPYQYTYQVRHMPGPEYHQSQQHHSSYRARESLRNPYAAGPSSGYHHHYQSSDYEYPDTPEEREYLRRQEMKNQRMLEAAKRESLRATEGEQYHREKVERKNKEREETLLEEAIRRSTITEEKDKRNRAQKIKDAEQPLLQKAARDSRKSAEEDERKRKRELRANEDAQIRDAMELSKESAQKQEQNYWQKNYGVSSEGQYDELMTRQRAAEGGTDTERRNEESRHGRGRLPNRARPSRANNRDDEQSMGARSSAGFDYIIGSDVERYLNRRERSPESENELKLRRRDQLPRRNNTFTYQVSRSRQTSQREERRRTATIITPGRIPERHQSPERSHSSVYAPTRPRRNDRQEYHRRHTPPRETVSNNRDDGIEDSPMIREAMARSLRTPVPIANAQNSSVDEDLRRAMEASLQPQSHSEINDASMREAIQNSLEDSNGGQGVQEDEEAGTPDDPPPLYEIAAKVKFAHAYKQAKKYPKDLRSLPPGSFPKQWLECLGKEKLDTLQVFEQANGELIMELELKRSRADARPSELQNSASNKWNQTRINLDKISKANRDNVGFNHPGLSSRFNAINRPEEGPQHPGRNENPNQGKDKIVEMNDLLMSKRKKRMHSQRY
ncbi:MAG: hypothetical protein M1834_005805 [Cirrosporium novae-zelandiae]|nr:MAG: hypothetical protein M1834_005805 [Cirrosporium novae-zelandiae]